MMTSRLGRTQTASKDASVLFAALTLATASRSNPLKQEQAESMGVPRGNH